MAWELRESDRELFDRELASFVPLKVFDAHAHLYDFRQFAGPPPVACREGPPTAGLTAYRECIEQVLPGRRPSGLFFGFPDPHVDFAAANAFLAAEVATDPGSRGLMLVRPEIDPDFIRQEVQRQGFVGLKCYHFFSPERPTFDAAIESFLPDEQVGLADELGLAIMLHIVRRTALADPANQATIRRYAERYPNARLVLAHAARGFNPHHTILGIESLRGLDNVWFDTSAVTDPGAIEAIARVCGTRRIVYGSDFPITHLRGRCVAIGDSFLWLSPENTRFDAPYAQIEPALVGLESLRALKVACISLGLGDAEVQGIFSENAEELLGLCAAGKKSPENV